MFRVTPRWSTGFRARFGACTDPVVAEGVGKTIQHLRQDLLFGTAQDAEQLVGGLGVGSRPRLRLTLSGGGGLQECHSPIGVVGAPFDQTLAGEGIDEGGRRALRDSDGPCQVGESNRPAPAHLEQNFRTGSGYTLAAETLVEGADECLAGAAERIGKLGGTFAAVSDG